MKPVRGNMDTVHNISYHSQYTIPSIYYISVVVDTMRNMSKSLKYTNWCANILFLLCISLPI